MRIRLGNQLVRVLAVAPVLLLLSTPVSAEIFQFGCITSNSAGDCAILENQIQMEVTGGTATNGDPIVNFTFTNTGTSESSLTDVYFSDLLGLLSTPMYITSSAGVSFSGGCAPPDLPGGQDFGFVTSYCADSNSPTQPRGVNPGEWLTISYTLQDGATLADVLLGFPTHQYAVGVHVQGFSSGGSESAVALPEPSSFLLLGLGAFFAPLLRGLRRRAM